MKLRLAAYAKINLGLEILRRREDGFHELVSVTQTISLADTIDVSPGEPCTVTMTPPLVEDGENLVGRAATALAAHTGRPPSGQIHLTKRIPLAAGLGGGSSDAASTLRLLDRLWGTGLGPRGLGPIAAELGSDVSLFLAGGACLIRGRGEEVEQLPPAPPFWLALVCPDISPPDKTRALYRALQPSEWSDGAQTLALAKAIRAGRPLAGAGLINSFDNAANRVYPQFQELRARLQTLTGQPFHLTGAGPTLFALFESEAAASSAAATIERGGLTAHVARSIARLPAVRASDG